jgi:hypothetical protein
MRIDEIKAELKAANPTLKRGSDEDGYVEISGDEYEAIIDSWAEDTYAKELEAQAKAQAKSERIILLNKLGITEDEAKLLLS